MRGPPGLDAGAMRPDVTGVFLRRRGGPSEALGVWFPVRYGMRADVGPRGCPMGLSPWKIGAKESDGVTLGPGKERGGADTCRARRCEERSSRSQGDRSCRLREGNF